MSVTEQRFEFTEHFPVPEVFATDIAETIRGEYTTTVVFCDEFKRATGRVTFPNACWDKIMADKTAGRCSAYGEAPPH